MLGIGSTLLNPTFQQGNFRFTQGFTFARRRHLQIRIITSDANKQLTFLRISRSNGGITAEISGSSRK